MIRISDSMVWACPLSGLPVLTYRREYTRLRRGWYGLVGSVCRCVLGGVVRGLGGGRESRTRGVPTTVSLTDATIMRQSTQLYTLVCPFFSIHFCLRLGTHGDGTCCFFHVLTNPARTRRPNKKVKLLLPKYYRG